MDDVCLDDNTTNIEVKSADLVPNSDSSDMDDKFGEPQVLPRVGEQYQVEIPSLIAVPDISQLTMNSEIKVNLTKSFSLGLPMPLMHPYCKVESCCGASESVNSEERKVFSENESAELKFKPNKSCGVSESISIDQKKVRGLTNSLSSLKRDKIDVDSYSELRTELDHSNIFSGSLGESWLDTEYNSFLLSLYVFGKNLNLVKKFIGSKKMGDILFFYYGKFYRSKGYRRWSECRKSRTRRCIYGQKIFTGWRQQELLSRLFPHISEGCQNMLVELSGNFGEGKMPFEEYVFALKEAVGMDLLINSVAIGKGKQDLTGIAVEPTKTKHIFSVRSEIPIGKACSSLTPADIIKFLTGNFRLSKARSSDLFWEAVWPRLLARGWRSEQPKDLAVSGSKQSLVFLTPGVKKFSRRRLVKGSHYFDSVSDVLNKVASEPWLLEIEVKAGEANVDMIDRQGKQDPNSPSDKKQHCYLQPHSSSRNQDLMKFTIVDTSMVCGLGQRQVRELRSMPFQTTNISLMLSPSSETDQDTSEESESAIQQTNTSIPVEESTDKGPSIDSSDCTYIPEALNAIEVAVENHKYDSDVINDEHSRETSNCQLDQPVKADWAEYSPPLLKKQKLAACNHEEYIHSTESTSITRNFDLNLDLNIDLNESISPSDLCDVSEGLVFSVGVQNLPSQYSLSEGNPKRSNEGSASGKGFILSVGVQNLPSSASQAEGSSHRSNEGFASEKGFVLSVGIQNLPSTSSLAKSSPNRSNEGSASASENYLGGEVFAENSETRPLIDLNISPEMEDEMERPSSEVILQNNDHQSANTSCFLSKLTQLNDRQEFPDDHKGEQTSMINRRQSTRNRPLTTKALEALEYRFLNSKKKRKNVESSHSSPKSQCLHFSDGTMITATCDDNARNGMAGTNAEEENLIAAYSTGINLNEEVQYSF